jgi:hypothetical protein
MLFGLDDDRLNRGVPLSAIFDYDRSAFRCNQERDVPARFTGEDAEEWHVLITPPLCGWRGGCSWLRSRSIRDQGSACFTMYHSLSPEMHGGLSPVRTQRICEYIASNLDRNIRLERLAEMAGLSSASFLPGLQTEYRYAAALLHPSAPH